MVHGLDSLSGYQLRGNIQPRQDQSAVHHLGIPLRQGQRSLQPNRLWN